MREIVYSRHGLTFVIDWRSFGLGAGVRIERKFQQAWMAVWPFALVWERHPWSSTY